ncbi:MAG: biotin--[acetyl-CoA-carboxylase] ligase [Burkholderiaceae bacterium]
MTGHALHWNAQALWQELEPLLPGLSVEVVARTLSTNSALLERARIGLAGHAEDGAPFGRRAADLQPCLLVAEHQTGGRGRLGKSWQSQPGASLTFSLSMPLVSGDWSGLSLAIGVALAQALDAPLSPTPAPRIGIKWPNDLWLMDAPLLTPPAGAAVGDAPAGRKLGGILVETVNVGPHRLAVVGIGLNVLPLADAADPVPSGVACLQEIDPQASAPRALAQVALPLVQALRRFEHQGFARFAAAYASRDLLLGRRVQTTLTGTPEGIACGVTPQGALRLQTERGIATIASGEVSVRLSGLPTASAPC